MRAHAHTRQQHDTEHAAAYQLLAAIPRLDVGERNYPRVGEFRAHFPIPARLLTMSGAPRNKVCARIARCSAVHAVCMGVLADGGRLISESG